MAEFAKQESIKRLKKSWTSAVDSLNNSHVEMINLVHLWSDYFNDNNLQNSLQIAEKMEESEQKRQEQFRDFRKKSDLIFRGLNSLKKKNPTIYPKFTEVKKLHKSCKKSVAHETQNRDKIQLGRFFSTCSSEKSCVFYNPVIKAKDMISCLKKVMDKFTLFIPKQRSQDCHRQVYSLVHSSSNIVCNLFFDVLIPKEKTEGTTETPTSHSHQNMKNSLSLYDVSFHHLREDENFDIHDISAEYYSVKNNPTFQQISMTMKQNPRFTLKKKVSKYELLNQITLALKRKYRKYVMFGELRNLFPKILEISLRYMDSINRIKCEKCSKFVKINLNRTEREASKLSTAGSMTEYPVLNHGNKFYHESCCPEEIKSKIM